MILVFLLLLIILTLAIVRELDRGQERLGAPAADCPSCAGRVEADWLLCPRCRTLLRCSCTSCGKHRAVYHRFCPWCGRPQEAS